jgi:DNA-binding protein YbaB
MSGELFDVALSDLSVLGDPESLRAQAEAVVRAGGAEPRQADHYDGTDDTGSVKVTVDPGGRVSDVVIRPVWTDKLGVEQLADGIYGAYVAAVRNALAIAAATREDRPAPARPGAGWPTLPGPGEADFDTWLAGVSATVAVANARLQGLPAPEPLPDEDFRSPKGFLTLRMRAGSLAGIDGNPAALRWTDADALRRDALSVFRDAGLAEPRHETRGEDDETNEDLGVFDY